MSSNPNAQTNPLPDVPWDDGVYVVHATAKNMAVGHTRTLLLMQDPGRQQDAHVCNISRVDGMVCRMPRGHDGLHVPFTGEHVSVTGVYVVAVQPADGA